MAIPRVKLAVTPKASVANCPTTVMKRYWLLTQGTTNSEGTELLASPYLLDLHRRLQSPSSKTSFMMLESRRHRTGGNRDEEGIGRPITLRCICFCRNHTQLFSVWDPHHSWRLNEKFVRGRSLVLHMLGGDFGLLVWVSAK